MFTVRAAARPTKSGTKVYIHAGCRCVRINGTLLRDITSVTAADACAADTRRPPARSPAT